MAIIVKAILIKTIKDIYPVSEKNRSVAYKNNAINRDLGFIMFDLLDKSFYTDDIGNLGNMDEIGRYNMYVANFANLNLKSSARSKRFERIRNNCMKYLLEQEDREKLLKESIIDYTDKQSGGKRTIKFQKPCFILEAPLSFPSKSDDEIAKYIAKTQTASYHDEFSHEIYAALCHEGESPYSEWVATWLLKCIKKKFKGCNAKQDLMNASFALLVGYELDINNEDQLRCRLHRYLNQSGFAKLIEKNPDPQKRFYSEITDNQLREQVLDIALKYELSYFAELMGYIKTIRTPEKHIKKLDKFGRYNADYSAYAYKPQKIHITERSIDIKEFVDRTEKRINSFLCLLVISIVFTGISIFYLSNKPLSYQSIINPEDESGRPTNSFDSTPLDGGGGRQNDLTYGKVSNHLLDIVNKYMSDLLTSQEDS